MVAVVLSLLLLAAHCLRSGTLLLVGTGQIVEDYCGNTAKKFTHKKLK